MTQEAQKQIAEAKTTEEKIKAVNKILMDGEPKNVSYDTSTSYTGYKPKYLIDAMNAVFKIGQWGFEEIGAELVTSQTDKGTIPTIAIVQVKVWIKPVEFTPVGYGQSRITRGDVGDAKKGAQTDAIKKALSYFSIGNRAYHGLLKTA